MHPADPYTAPIPHPPSHARSGQLVTVGAGAEGFFSRFKEAALAQAAESFSFVSDGSRRLFLIACYELILVGARTECGVAAHLDQTGHCAAKGMSVARRKGSATVGFHHLYGASRFQRRSSTRSGHVVM